MHLLSGTALAIFYSTNLILFIHRRAAKLMMPDLSLTTDAKLQHLGLLPLREKLMLNKAVLVFKAFRNLAPQYLKDLFICHNSRAPSRSMILPKPRIDLLKTSIPLELYSNTYNLMQCTQQLQNPAPQMAQK